MDSIGIEATSRSSGDVHNLNLPTVLGMLLLFVVLGVISSRRLKGRGLAVHHLFLKISLKRGQKNLTGFVRSLDIDSMKLVMTEEPQKGEILTFNFNSLPGFSVNRNSSVQETIRSEIEAVAGTVQSVKPISGSNQNFLVTVSLNAATKSDEVSNTLVSYLRHLHA